MQAESKSNFKRMLSSIINVILLFAVIFISYKYRKVCQELASLRNQAKEVPGLEQQQEDDGQSASPGLSLTTSAETSEEEGEEESKPRMMLVGLDAPTISVLHENIGEDFLISVVDDSRNAIEQAREQSPDIIISDYLMPGITGDILCRQLKSSVETSHIAVVFLTALSDSSDIVYGLEAGASDYITKPFEISVLRARLNRVLAQQQTVQKDAVGANLDKKENDDIDYSSPIDRKFMDRVNNILAEKMGDFEFTTNDLYRELGMSRTVVYNKLKALTGHAPSNYIHIIRLNKAMQLLKSREYNVSEVAFRVGYADPKYFSTSFKRQFGISPSKV